MSSVINFLQFEIYRKQARLYGNSSHNSYPYLFLIWEKAEDATNASLPNRLHRVHTLFFLLGNNDMVVSIT